MRVMSNLTNLEGLGVEARLAGLAAEDAADARRQSQLQRESAQQDRVQLLRQAADKLREMAGNAIWQGVVSGAAMAASAAIQAGSGFLTDKLGNAGQAAQHVGKARIQWLAAGSKAADAVGVTGAAPFQASTARLQAEKQDLETDAEQAGARAQAASDDVSEAQRMQGSMTSLMEKMLESRHAAMMASVKG